MSETASPRADAGTDDSGHKLQLANLCREAIDEMIAAVHAMLADGAKVERTRDPQMSLRDNGMNSITNFPPFGGNGAAT